MALPSFTSNEDKGAPLSLVAGNVPVISKDPFVEALLSIVDVAPAATAVSVKGSPPDRVIV